ncbi:MAG: hypothetical protein JEY91_04185 [Spirochaetaceae bacterium]|nr:hypothetical protein [Spirochaetaceae bacterium]
MDITKRADVPRSLKMWFVVHFFADILFAIPMFFLPVKFFTALGWEQIDPIATRMVAAALFGIGIESLLSRNATIDSFKTMLSLKIIWSTAALAGLSWGLIAGVFGNTLVGISLLGIFILFNILWTYWYIRLNKNL